MSQQHNPALKLVNPNYPIAPASIEAEEALLGAVLTDPTGYFTAEHITPDHFFILRNRYVWDAMQRVMSRRDELDFISLQDELRGMGRLDEIGGASYLLQLVNNSPNSQNAGIYTQLVERSATRRLLMIAADDIKKLAQDETQAIEVVTSASEARLLKALGGGAGRPLASVGEVAGNVWENAARIREDGRPRAIPTMLDRLNAYNLMVAGRYGIIAGRPGMGKSWMLLILALWFAHKGHPVFFFSLEMTEEDLTERALTIMSGVQSQKLDNGTASQKEWEAFTEAAGNVNKLPLFIDTPPSGQPMTPALLRARVRRGLHQYPTDKTPFIMLDYIQHERMSGGERFERQTNRHRELSYASAALAALAIDTQSMVITAAQLGREVADRADKTPVKEDLKESGSLEQDAWWVMLLHSEDYYNNPQASVVNLDVIIDKNRGGQMGREQFKFDKSVGRIG